MLTGSKVTVIQQRFDCRAWEESDDAGTQVRMGMKGAQREL